jgi:hypothetical protein
MSAASLLVSGRETGIATSQEVARPCSHERRCPSATAPDRLAARVVATHPEQGWSLLCNGVIAFEDGGAITPQGHAVPVLAGGIARYRVAAAA